jgi:ABC-type phosphate transport system permease subunit
MNTYKRRKIASKFMCAAAFLCAFLTLVPLISIFGYVFAKGVASLNLDFFSNLPRPVGEAGGGMSNAIIGTLILIGLSCLWAIPLGIIGGIFLSEFGNNKLGTIVRFTADVLNGVPSIVIGIFAYTVFVLPMKSFSAISGDYDTDDNAHDRRDAADGAPDFTRGRDGFGHQPIQDDRQHSVKDRVARDSYGDPVGHCADRGRDGAAPLYRLW